jgi:hypothetical protein
MIVEVCRLFMLDTTVDLFEDHEDGDNEILVEDDHKTKLIKCTADKYFTLRRYFTFTFSKKYNKETVVNKVIATASLNQFYLTMNDFVKFILCSNKETFQLTCYVR